MPDLNCVKNGPYPFLRRFDTEKLRQILRDNFELEDSGTLENDELITCVMGVIAQREENDPRFRKFDVNVGRRDFQQNYQPTEEDMAQVHDPTASSEFIRNNKQGKQATLKTPQSKRAVHRIPRIMASLCMVAVDLRGTYTFVVRNNSNYKVSVSGFVNY